MPVRMSHPAHGVLHAVGSEVEWNMKNGWKVDEENQDCAGDATLDDLRARWLAKFGEKPHHKKSAKTLLSELE